MSSRVAFLLNVGCLLITQLQDVGVMRDEELQRLDVLESEADQRFSVNSLKFILCYKSFI